MRPKILMTRAVFPEVVQRLGQYFDVEDNQQDRIFSAPEFAEKLRNKDGLYTTAGEKITADLIASGPRLKIISNMAVGFNNIDVAAATRAGRRAV